MKGLAAVIALGVLVAAGCAVAGRPSVLSVQTAQSLTQCPLLNPNESPMLAVLNDNTQWAATLQGSPASVLGREPRWADERVLVFSLGRQPTLGVGVGLLSPQLAVHGNTLDLVVNVHRPGPGQMAAMALSWPCVIAAVPRAGWGTARVLDAQGVEVTRSR